VNNLFQTEELPAEGTEIFSTLYENPALRIARIVSVNVHNSEWYDQTTDEWVVLLKGTAVIEFEQRKKTLKEGDYLFIRRHERHRVASTSADAVWLALHISS
jgi:cupin 2 domain-containing protein